MPTSQRDPRTIPHMRYGPPLLAVGLLFTPVLGQSADVYRWVDDQGRTHVADTVPERYRGVATRLDSQGPQPSAQQRSEAIERAAKDRARLAELDAARQAQAPASSASAATSPPVARRNSSGGSECDRMWQEYFDSQVCFGPYHLGQGGVRAEAHGKCKEVLNPSQQCGPAKYVPQ